MKQIAIFLLKRSLIPDRNNLTARPFFKLLRIKGSGKAERGWNRNSGKRGIWELVYAQHFGDHRPARAAGAVRTLPKNVDGEIEAIARLP